MRESAYPWVVLQLEPDPGHGQQLLYRDELSPRGRGRAPRRWVRARSDPRLAVPDELGRWLRAAWGRMPAARPAADPPRLLPVFLASDAVGDLEVWRTMIDERIAEELPEGSHTLLTLARGEDRRVSGLHLPLTILAVGPEEFASRALGPLGASEWLRDSPAMRLCGLELLDRPSFSWQSRPEIVVTSADRLGTLLADVGDVRQGISRPRLLVCLEENPGAIDLAGRLLPTGVSLLVLPDGEAMRSLTRCIASDLPLHEAVALATRTRRPLPFVSSPKRLQSLRLAAAARDIEVEVRDLLAGYAPGGRQKMPRRRGSVVEGVVDMPEFEERLGDRWRQISDLGFRLTSDLRGGAAGLEPLARVLLEVGAERRERPRLTRALTATVRDPQMTAAARDEQERRVDVWLERLEQSPLLLPEGRLRIPDLATGWVDRRVALRGGARYRLCVHIGHVLPSTLLSEPPPPVGPLLPALEEGDGHHLEVTVYGLDFELEGTRVRPLYLPAFGPSERVAFTVRAPRDVARARLRVAVYHRNHHLQSFLLTARVAEEETARARRQLRAELEYSRSARFGNLDRLGSRRLTLGLNQAGDTHSLLVKGDGEAWDFSVSAGVLEGQVKESRALLAEIARGPKGSKEWRFSTWSRASDRSADARKRFEEAVRRMAGFGKRLHDALFQDADERLDAALEAVADGDDEVVQIVHFSSRFAFPWALLYDRPDPVTPGARVCPGYEAEAPNEGAIEPCNHGADDAGGGICLRGFWGVRHRLELLLPTDSKRRNTQQHLERPPRPPLICLATGPPDSHRRRLREELRRALGRDEVAQLGTDDDLMTMLWGEKDQPAERPAAVVFHAHHGRREILGVDRSGMVLSARPDFFHDGLVLDRRKRARKAWSQPRSICFLMACGAAALSIDTVTALAPALIKAGALAVAGTEVEVTEALAARFAEEVLHDLFVDGAQLGEASVSFRRKLLAEGNPLGFLFTVYGDAELSVAP